MEINDRFDNLGFYKTNDFSILTGGTVTKCVETKNFSDVNYVTEEKSCDSECYNNSDIIENRKWSIEKWIAMNPNIYRPDFTEIDAIFQYITKGKF
jgi:hypothetical protein